MPDIYRRFFMTTNKGNPNTKTENRKLSVGINKVNWKILNFALMENIILQINLLTFLFLCK